MNKNNTATKFTKNKLLKEIFIILITFQMIFLPTSSFAETSSSNNLPTDTLLSSSTYQDSDDDGISDYLELNGYMIDNENNIVQWDGNGNKKYHKSDPNSASTTGDPYDDRSKLAGSGLHSPIDPIAKNNPEVAATPNLQVELLGIGLSPKITTTTEESGGSSDGSSHQQGGSSTDSHSFTTGVSIGFEHTFKVTEGPSTKMSVQTSFEHSYAMQKTSTWNIEQSTSNFRNWLKSKQVDESDAAALSLDLKYTNTGLTPLSNIRPKFTIIAGDENVVTYTPFEAQQAIDYLAPGQSKQITVDRITKSDTLSLSLSQLNKVLDNRKLKIKMVEVLADIPGKTTSTSNIFSYYQDDIKGRTADIEIRRTKDNGDTYTAKTYQVIAEHSSYNPHMTLKRALQLTMNAEIRSEGNLYLENQNINNWNISYNDELKTRISSLDYNEKKYYDVELNYNDHIILYEPIERETPEIRWFAYSDDYKNVGVNVARGNDEISNVTVTVSINDTEQTVTLNYNPNINLYVNETAFTSIADASYRSKITVTTKSGNIIDKYITPEKDGFGYVPLSNPVLLMGKQETMNLSNGNSDIDLSNYPNARAIVVQVTSNRWSAPKDSVTLGNVTAELGTADLHIPSWKLKLTDNTGTVHTLEGTGELYELKDVSKKNIPNDSISKVEIIGDRGFVVQLYQHGDFNFSEHNDNNAWTFDNINGNREYNLKDFNAQDKVTSLRVAYVGSNQRNAIYHLWLRDSSNGKVVYKRGNKNLAADLTQLGVGNDYLGDYSFIAYPTLKFHAYEHGQQQGNMWPAGDSISLEDIPPIPGREQLYEMIKTNYYPATSHAKQHGEGISSISITGFDDYNKDITYLKGAKNSPVISKTLVVPVMGSNLRTSWDIQNGVRNLDYQETDAWIDVELLGYFTDQQNEGYKYNLTTKTYGSNSRTNTVINGTSDTYRKFFTGINDAKGYIVNVINDKISSDKVSITINEVTTNLGASDSRLTEKDWHNTNKDSDWSASNDLADDYRVSYTKSMRKDNLLFIPANPSSPAYLDISTVISEYKTTSSSTPRIFIQVLGYFSEDADLVFVPDHKEAPEDVTDKNQLFAIAENIDEGHFPKVFLSNLVIPYNEVFDINRLQNGIFVSINNSSQLFYTFADHYIGDRPIKGLYYLDNRPLRDYNINQSWNDTSLVYMENDSDEYSVSIGTDHWPRKFDLLGYFH